MPCIFCQIVNKKIPATIVYEDDKILIFQDIKPIAPVHLLIIPKRHIAAIDCLELDDKDLIGELFLAAQNMVQKQGIAETGYRLIFNVGKDAGQTVDHLHLHLLGGKKLSWI